MILTGGTATPSSKKVRASVGSDPGTLPPTSVMWPNIAAQAITRPSLYTGISSSQSLMWLIAPLQE